MWTIYIPAIQEMATLHTQDAVNWVKDNLKESQLKAYIQDCQTKTILRIN